jgi:hypothetical protein
MSCHTGIVSKIESKPFGGWNVILTIACQILVRLLSDILRARDVGL